MKKDMEFEATCPICTLQLPFSVSDDYWACRDGLSSAGCPLGGCVTRERAIATAIFSVWTADAVKALHIHEAAAAGRGISLWLRQHCPNYVSTGYFPERPFGSLQNGTRNEDLGAQTFESNFFDLVIHLDVMEHLFEPFRALDEIFRTLKPGGYCIFTAPTYQERIQSEQVAFLENGGMRVTGEPEYHGNPQRPEDGALVTWRYGHDLPLQIYRNTGFKNVEHRRYQWQDAAVMGYMDDVYLLRKQQEQAGHHAR
jgi:SAM-dependent methyltransferase